MSQVHQIILRFRQQAASVSTTAPAAYYHVQVVKAPGRGWGGPMLVTGLAENEVREIRAAYRGFIARQQASGEVAGAWTAEPLQQLGNQLFAALPETVQTRWQHAQAYAQARGGNLEVMLMFEPSAVSLLDLPWELLHDPHGRFFYGLRGGGISRCLLLPTASVSKKPLLPANTVGLWAEPSGLEPLAERRRYSPAPGKEDGFTWLQGPDSLAQLKQALHTGEFDSLHLVAHGRVGSAWDFALALADGHGRPHWLDPQQFALFLSNYPAIRFIYLDVCAAGDGRHTVTETSYPDAPPGGIAALLLGIGVTAVIAMQDRISQTAAGLMAELFYQELGKGQTVATAMTEARRAVQLQQADVIHWSIPALYRQRPLPEATSPAADWILDIVATPAVLGAFFLGLLLALLIGRLSYLLALADWLTLPAWLVACASLPILAAAITRQGQAELAEMYGYTGWGWLPFLWHKYFSAAVWAMMAWFVLWLVWLGVYGAGVAQVVGLTGRQVVWALGLLGVALAAHVAARQAVRQDRLFRRVGFTLFRGKVMDAVVLLVLLLAAPFFPLILAWLLWSLWSLW